MTDLLYIADKLGAQFKQGTLMLEQSKPTSNILGNLYESYRHYLEDENLLTESEIDKIYKGFGAYLED